MITMKKKFSRFNNYVKVRILKRLGCSNCQARGRSFIIDQLRSKARLLLNKLRLLHQHRFEKCFLNFAVNADLVHILDILHSLCGYCAESNIGLAHYAPYIPTKPDIQLRQTYSNNFGNTHLGIGPKGIDGFILNIIFKPLVIRLNKMEEYLLTSENVVLYCECRALLIYVKENHGGIFRLAVFSSLMDPEKKLKTLRQTIKDKFIQQNDSKISLNHDSTDNINGNIDQQLQTQSNKEGQLPFNSTRVFNGPLTGGDDCSSDGHHEENLYVDLTLVRTGLLRLNCLIESCPPGSLPDPQFLNSLLFLDAPIISKAAFLIECAHYVRCCSLGQWPVWMRMNMTTFRPHDKYTGRPSGTINLKLNKIYQAAAARMFYIWGDTLSSQLETMLDIEQQQNSTAHLWNKDEIFEDYYNEAIVNPSGHDCPYSLKLIVCLLLYEITSFLRETYETLPKLSTLQTGEVNNRQQRTNNSQNIIDTSSIITDKRFSGRQRKDSILSQASNRSTVSGSNEQPPLSPQLLSTKIIHMNPSAYERHISFAIKRENDSNESHHTTVIMNDDDSIGVMDGYSTSVSLAANKRKSIAGFTVKSKLNRRNSGKLTKLPVRMKEAGKSAHRLSFRARRRSHISNISSDTDFHQNNIEYSTMEPTNEYPTCTEDEYDLEKFDNIINTRSFPWIKVIIRIFNNVNLTCNHQIKCLSNCYEKQTKSCKNLFNALLNMYRLSSLCSRSSSIQTNLKFTETMLNKTQRFSTYFFGEQTADLHIKKGINTHFNTISTYLEKQVGSLMQIPLMTLCKSSVLLDNEHYSEILPLSWELLLDGNEELSSCAATMVILTAARANHLVEKLIHTEMENSSVLIRYNAILKFQILWRFRHQFWIRLEDGAHSMMKILPPSIEFVLPSPTLGLANLQTVDPPWMPYVKTLVQQVALNQEEVRAVVTTSKTRKKHQQELLHSALMTEEISKRVARENFSMSIVSMLQAASFEPLLYQLRDDEEEAYIDDDRIVDSSIQLCQAQGTFPSVFGAAIFHLVEMLEDEEIIENGAIDESRASDIYDTRPTTTEKIRLDTETREQMKNNDDITTRTNSMYDRRPNNNPTTNTFHFSQQQLSDTNLNLSWKKRPKKIRANEALNILETYYARYRIRCGVSGAARKVLWTCLLDEPTLLIRFFFEKISHKERRIKSLQSLHHLMIYFTDIPPQFAHAIFNYVLGLLLSMVRSPLDGSQELIANGLTLLWQIIPYLHGLVLKDLKQILRKEQAEMLILVTGNVPSTKKVIIHGPDASQIPTQAIISEETLFSNVLQEALDFFGIPNVKRDRYYLVDVKTKQIHIPDTYVRDFYFFRRNIHPQLSLVYMDIKQSRKELEHMSIFLKTTELSKVLFARYLLENTPFNQIHNCITFFHDEFIKSPLFPRKALESDFNLYTTIHDKELFHLDMLHKYNWTKLIACIFFNMDGKTSTTSDITLFLSVINGSFILHCEDLVMLRFCLATYINIVKHFRNVFATNG
ncbi:unnamed protein product [Rotaria sp. Silwood1]|nr:unnamed protein product [Rotaria sp. Silwood1]